ncbi:hypothetical protein ACQPZ2_34430 [Nocardia pseudovaccinii]|uniref:hypothetical protein n=1 Tax=Nocardia pseudovaccinii TaxID=189540 RepID=UPI003D8D6196
MEQQTFTEATDPFCLDQADAVALLTEAPWGRYAVVGDSLSAGTGDPTPGYKNQGWSDRVAGVLRSARPELDYLNVSRDRGDNRPDAGEPGGPDARVLPGPAPHAMRGKRHRAAEAGLR